MDGYKAWKLFTATRLHFTNRNYDVFKYKGRVSGSRESFEKRNDKKLFERLAYQFKTEKEYITFLVANFAYGNKGVVYNQSESFENYTLWMTRKDSFTRYIEQTLKDIVHYIEKEKIDSKSFYKCINGQIPLLLKMYLSGDVSIEIMSFLEDFDGYLNEWELSLSLWYDHFLVIKRVKPFIKYDSYKVASIYIDFNDALLENKFICV